MFRFMCVARAAAVAFPAADFGAKVAFLYGNGSAETNDAFQSAYGHFANTFDYDLYGRLVAGFEEGFERYNGSRAMGADVGGTLVPHCDRGHVATEVARVTGVAAFPGGVVGSVFSFDLGKRLLDLSEHARGPASAGLVAPMALASQALSTGMGLVQATVAAMIHVVPPLVPPPACVDIVFVMCLVVFGFVVRLPCFSERCVRMCVCVCVCVCLCSFQRSWICEGCA